MKIISIFNNKGGVGKTTLTYHLAHALALMGKRVLMIDSDPQCNLTIYGVETEELHKIWEQENKFIDDFNENRIKLTEAEFELFNSSPRTIHYILKPAEDGTRDLDHLPPPIKIDENLDLIPGRLTLHKYENQISRRWNGLYSKEPLSIRTVTQIRTIAVKYASERKYDFVIIDTSPSLGALNKVIISTVDGFLVPCLPDMFSLYGIKNIGNSLLEWQNDFRTIYSLMGDKRNMFPENFVRFLGFTIYNAKKYTSENISLAESRLNLAQAAFNYAKQIPETIEKHIVPEVRLHLTEKMLNTPIGEQVVMHTHNTLPVMAQKYRIPMWKIPALAKTSPIVDNEDKNTISGNQKIYERTKENYIAFAEDLLTRISCLD
ncbi:Cellulose biosynthesis protein BcsQ (plasmid) [Nostoc flagelliforme CCNUN1]|uniref:Cellulose biosynthesis protein BcsQ n=1 Tax=Nostoc flagelliforme CCNUN1 TaxID=2038116 RepID=A0A2K8T5W3_9NOSO|nr:ParA family protein [Nostoc flagelliforme]AUB43020.1 Cellulose biosynthesis protein BcsQ [Nostoc flagelliforme CCNUN1]